MNRLYEILATALEEPNEDWNARLDRCKQWLTIQEPEVAVQLISFRRKVRKLSIEELKKLYSQTFVLNPLCSLDIGNYLFENNDKRVGLLARLRETEAAYELGQANQSPDHLPVLLRLLAKLEHEDRCPLISKLLIPALAKMFDALNQANNPYQDLIEVISNAIRNELPTADSSQTADAIDGSGTYRTSSTAAANEKEVMGSSR